MQGRLSALVDGHIQAFPWTSWQEEFPIAHRHGFRLMEWTLDSDRLRENPLLTAAGQAEIATLSRRYDIGVLSLTGDCFMQSPLWKTVGEKQERLKEDFRAVATACAIVGIAIVVVPLVDNGRLENMEQEDVLIHFLEGETPILAAHGLRVVFESDFDPPALARFIARLDPQWFGVNYDIGNSAALGFNAAEEITRYGHRIMSVHVKDRVLGGTTVPLGTGNADFETVFAALGRSGYTGNYVLQTARAADSDHVGALCRYRDMTVDWMGRHGA